LVPGVLSLSGHADANDVEHDGDADEGRRVAEERHCKQERSVAWG